MHCCCCYRELVGHPNSMQNHKKFLSQNAVDFGHQSSSILHFNTKLHTWTTSKLKTSISSNQLGNKYEAYTNFRIQWRVIIYVPKRVLDLRVKWGISFLKNTSRKFSINFFLIIHFTPNTHNARTPCNHI